MDDPETKFTLLRTAMLTELPAVVRAMAVRGPDWAAWVDRLPALTRDVVALWQLRPDGPWTPGYCSLVLPVRTPEGAAAVLKIGFPDDESEHEHLALRRWSGAGAVKLLSADPHRRALLLERLHSTDLTALTDLQACHVVAEDQTHAADNVPTFASIARRPGFTADKIATFLREPHPKMPDMQITNGESADLAAYIVSLGK